MASSGCVRDPLRVGDQGGCVHAVRDVPLKRARGCIKAGGAFNSAITSGGISPRCGLYLGYTRSREGHLIVGSVAAGNASFVSVEAEVGSIDIASWISDLFRRCQLEPRCGAIDSVWMNRYNTKIMARAISSTMIKYKMKNSRGFRMSSNLNRCKALCPGNGA